MSTPTEAPTQPRISVNDTIVGVMLDITAPLHGVEVLISSPSLIHINVDGICRLRICRAPRIILEDNRR